MGVVRKWTDGLSQLSQDFLQEVSHLVRLVHEALEDAEVPELQVDRQLFDDAPVSVHSEEALLLEVMFVYPKVSGKQENYFWDLLLISITHDDLHTR